MREVGEGDGLESRFDGGFAERGDGAPGGSVVNILGGGYSAFDRFDEGVEHEEVHAAMAGAFGVFAIALPERVVVFSEPGIGGIPFVVCFALAFDVDGFSDVHPKAVGALNAEAEGVWAGVVGIVLEKDRFTVRAMDLGSHDVAEAEADGGIGVVFAAVFYDIIMKAARFGGEGGDREEAVATVDIGHHGEGADAVGRVQVTVTVDGVVGPPAGFGECFLTEFDAVVVGRLAVVELNAPQVMLVAALEVEELAE